MRPCHLSSEVVILLATGCKPYKELRGTSALSAPGSQHLSLTESKVFWKNKEVKFSRRLACRLACQVAGGRAYTTSVLSLCMTRSGLNYESQTLRIRMLCARTSTSEKKLTRM